MAWTREKKQEYMKAYRLRNLERRRAYGRTYYVKNRSLVIARTKAWSKAHPEHRKAYMHRYYKTHPKKYYLSPSDRKVKNAKLRAKRRADPGICEWCGATSTKHFGVCCAACRNATRWMAGRFFINNAEQRDILKKLTKGDSKCKNVLRKLQKDYMQIVQLKKARKGALLSLRTARRGGRSK